MRYWVFGAVAAAFSAAGAAAADSSWGYFEDGASFGAGVQAADGAQLILKCDKKGKHQVFAVVVAQQNLAPPLPASKYQSQPVEVRMDTGSPYKDDWRANDHFAMAVDQGNTRSLTRLLEKLDSAGKMEIVLRPLKATPTTISFPVSGAHDAIAKVYETCQDELPLAKSAGA
jgi:hypothetical protein